MITSFPLGKHHESLATAEGRLHQSILLYSSQDGKEATIFPQQTGSLGEQQDPCCVFPPYSGQPDPGQCAASCHHCDWGRGRWSTDPGPAGGAQPLHQGTFGLIFAMDQHPEELHVFSPVNVTSHPMQGYSTIQARMVPEDTQHKQEFMPIFSTAWLSVGLIIPTEE